MKLYVGVDVSKSKLDVSLNGKNLIIPNNLKGLSNLIEKLKEQNDEGNEIGLVLCEASGGYERLLIKTLFEEGYPVHLAHANKIAYYHPS